MTVIVLEITLPIDSVDTLASENMHAATGHLASTQHVHVSLDRCHEPET